MSRRHHPGNAWWRSTRPFCSGAYDRVIHDVVNQKLPVLFAIDRAGLVGADGPTHNGSYDLTFLRCLPHMVVMAPADENECRQMLYTGFLLPRLCDTRAAKDPVALNNSMTALPLGKAEMRREGHGLALLCFGTMLAPALEAAEVLDTTVVNMRFVRPLDEEMLLDLAGSHARLVTVEENVVAGVAEILAAHGCHTPWSTTACPTASSSTARARRCRPMPV